MRPPYRRTTLALSSAALLLAAVARQAETEQPAGQAAQVEAGVAATIDGEAISLDEYKDYLYTNFGRRPLRGLVYRKLVEREVARLDVEVSEEAVQKEFEDVWKMLLGRARGNEEKAVQGLVDQGFTKEGYRELILATKRHDVACAAICSATREVTEDKVRARFDADYGVDGIRVEVRHLLLNPKRISQELARLGRTPTDAQVRAEVESRATDLRKAIASDGFKEVAKRESHDPGSTRAGGVIQGYNYQRFGPELAAAVRAAKVEQLSGPIWSSHGAHLFEVTSRVETKLEDVRAEVERRVREEPASFEELKALEERLFAEAEIVGL